MIHEIEAAKNLGDGGFYDLPRERQAALLGWWRVRTNPDPKSSRRRKRNPIKEAAMRAATRRRSGGARG